jgi:natural product precursor
LNEKYVLFLTHIIKKIMTMKKLKLNKLSDQHLAEKQTNMVRGGAEPGGGICNCYCACAYADQGGSSTADNQSANNAGGLYSPQGVVKIADRYGVILQ